MKIAITTSSFAKFSQEPLQLLAARGIEYVLNPHGRALREEEIAPLLEGCVGVAAGTEPYTKAVLAALPGLKVISRCGVGMDNVDLPAAKDLGIAVCNTPEGPTEAVAELVLGLALDLLRGISLQDRAMRAGVWKKHMGSLLAGRRVGIVGMGRIGRAVQKKFDLLGAITAYADPYVENGPCQRFELDELLASSELISLHVAGPAKGEGPLLDARRVNLLPAGAWLINCARGGVVDEAALFARLKDGSLAGAALDVFEEEPYTGPLLDLENTLLTPHIGSYARQARAKMEEDTILNLLQALGLN